MLPASTVPGRRGDQRPLCRAAAAATASEGGDAIAADSGWLACDE